MNALRTHWPELPYAAWRDTCTTFHLWTQIAGKVRLALSPWLNHSWHATFYVTPRGLTSGAIPCGEREFRIDFDLVEHALLVESSDGGGTGFDLEPMSVALFHRRLFAALDTLGIEVVIHPYPNEVPEAIRFTRDERHAAYEADAVHRWWQALVRIDCVFGRFRAGFLGKCSPVHLFWGSFDMAVTRFSGRTAPPHPGGIPNLPDRVTREAYSHEVSSAGFWPGGGPVDFPAFYSYAYPAPPGFEQARVQPAEAFYHAEAGEFILPYDAVRTATDPDGVLSAFLESTYAAAADLGGWDRSALEREPLPPT
jgi:hypothetical protein